MTTITLKFPSQAVADAFMRALDHTYAELRALAEEYLDGELTDEVALYEIIPTTK